MRNRLAVTVKRVGVLDRAAVPLVQQELPAGGRFAARGRTGRRNRHDEQRAEEQQGSAQMLLDRAHGSWRKGTAEYGCGVQLPTTSIRDRCKAIVIRLRSGPDASVEPHAAGTGTSLAAHPRP